jgi:hypothetical protein
MELNGVEDFWNVHWCGTNPEFLQLLRVWCEAGNVKLKNITMPKFEDREMHCMMVGYALSHPGATYNMWDSSTGQVHMTGHCLVMLHVLSQANVFARHFCDTDHGVYSYGSNAKGH